MKHETLENAAYLHRISVLKPGLKNTEAWEEQLCELAEVLITKHGMNVNCAFEGETPLFQLVGSCTNVGMVKCLIKHGAMIHCTDTFRQTPLHVLGRGRSSNTAELAEVAKLLIDTGADTLAINPQGISAVAKVIYKLPVDVIQCLASSMDIVSCINSTDGTLRPVTHCLMWETFAGSDTTIHEAGDITIGNKLKMLHNMGVIL